MTHFRAVSVNLIEVVTRGAYLIDKENVKILWDVTMQTDYVIEQRQPDIVVVDKDRALLINTAGPGDTRVNEKEQDTLDKYQDLTREIRRCFGNDSKSSEGEPENTGNNRKVKLIQRVALLRKA